ncbi:hypothetical protein V1291_001172 [Nitrobacteraceae bacterium AZCC 1564]
MRTLAVAAMTIALCATTAIAQPLQSDDVSINKSDIPKTVAAQVSCGTTPESILRKPFADGFIFRWPCASTHANQIEALIYATDVSGTDARLLQFPMPGQPSKVKPAPEIANVTWFPPRELTSVFVDPETRICRREGRWRLDGKKLAPHLIFWRETRDCEGKRGWRTVLDQTRSLKSK